MSLFLLTLGISEEISPTHLSSQPHSPNAMESKLSSRGNEWDSETHEDFRPSLQNSWTRKMLQLSPSVPPSQKSPEGTEAFFIQWDPLGYRYKKAPTQRGLNSRSTDEAFPDVVQQGPSSTSTISFSLPTLYVDFISRFVANGYYFQVFHADMTTSTGRKGPSLSMFLS